MCDLLRLRSLRVWLRLPMHQFARVFDFSSALASPNASALVAHAMAPLGRSSWKGTAQQLADVLLPLATDVSFCAYSSECRLVTQAKLHIKDVLKHSVLLEALKNLQGNLSFTQKVVEGALRIVLKHQKWKLSQAEGDSWVSVLGRRIRNLCRVVSQAEQKDRPAKWVHHLPWMKKCIVALGAPLVRRRRRGRRRVRRRRRSRRRPRRP